MKRFLYASLLAMPFMAQASTQIFALNNMDIIGAKADQICVVNGAKAISANINSYLKTHGHVPPQVLTQHFHQQLEDMSNIAICQGKAVDLGIKRLPAIVIDEKYVVYGVSNVEIAKAMVRQWRANHE